MWRHGRVDEVMNAGGYRVSPAEVEKRLLEINGVVEAAAAERPGRDATATIIKAYVVMHDGAARDETADPRHTAARISPPTNVRAR